ncbi:MAG TPA: LuxR C-terminal-related transcriptional regulator [Ktedonobacteraceae bacterium]|nr:LuxR C-terminal-related transcriptional regulator [Ktedonobacteraceae bacterium]
MQIHDIASSPERSEAHQEEVARKLHALVMRIRGLQTLVQIEEDGDDEQERTSEDGAANNEITVDGHLLRQSLHELEHMASEVLYEVQENGEGLILEELPGLPLGEALSQLVDTTAEKLALSSRVAFSGWERPLSDYLSRLLYRIAQEALAQTALHEGARRLRFRMEYMRSEVAMTIEDDGVPCATESFLSDTSGEAAAGADLPPFLSASHNENSYAQRLADQTIRKLRGMVENLGGSLVISGGIEQGVQVQVRIPLRRPFEHGEGHSHHHPQGASVHTDHQATPAAAAKVRVLIVDGQTVSRAGLRRLLESYADLEVVGEASDSVQAASETAELLPQIVLLDAQLPDNQSLETLRQVRQLNSDIHVLLLAGQEDETLLYEALRAGAGGYVLKDIAPDELASAVRGVARGDVLVQPQLAARLLSRNSAAERSASIGVESLTAREREVLQLLARGLRNKEIAARLFVSERTVNFHLANIYAKLHVSGRTEALSKALEQGLLKV